MKEPPNKLQQFIFIVYRRYLPTENKRKTKYEKAYSTRDKKKKSGEKITSTQRLKSATVYWSMFYFSYYMLVSICLFAVRSIKKFTKVKLTHRSFGYFHNSHYIFFQNEINGCIAIVEFSISAFIVCI